jgi:hypothetical protein
VESASRPLQVFELVGVLARHDVDYVLIGGVALQAHGHVRTTQDLDVIAAWTPENMRRLADALRDRRACAASTPTCSGSTSPTPSSSTTAATS